MIFIKRFITHEVNLGLKKSKIIRCLKSKYKRTESITAANIVFLSIYGILIAMHLNAFYFEIFFFY